MDKSIRLLRNALACASLACAVVALTAVVIAPAKAQAAAGNPDPAKTISITLTDAPVRTALAIVFQGAGLSYTVDPAVNGMINYINLRGVSFETALKAVLRSVTPQLEAVKDPDSGVYYIRVKSDALTQGTTGPNGEGQPNVPGGGSYPGGLAPLGGGGLTGQGNSASANGGVSLSNYETIQINYADVRLLIAAGILGTPSSLIPATSQSWGSGTSGGGNNGMSGMSGNNGMSGMSGMSGNNGMSGMSGMSGNNGMSGSSYR
jgi:hypothetical protein